MTYTHLTKNELVMIVAYYQAGKKVCDISKSLGRSRQTIYNVLSFLKTGHSAYDYYERYQTNKKRCGRKNTQLTKPVQDFIQSYLELDWSFDVIKGTYPERIPCSMRTLYRLADRGIFHKNDFPWQGKRNPNGKKKRVENKLFAEIFVSGLKCIQSSKVNSVILKGTPLLARIIKVLLLRWLRSSQKRLSHFKLMEEKRVILRNQSASGCHSFQDISSNPLPLIAGKSSPIGNPFQINMTLTFSLRIQAVRGSGGLMNILMVY